MFRLPINAFANRCSSAGRFAARAPFFVNQGTKLWLSTASSSGMYDKMAFIGSGKMAQAMIKPLIANGYQPEEKIAIYDVSTSTTKEVKKEFQNIQVAKSIEEVVTDADFVVCAVKPQNVDPSFWTQFPKTIRPDATFLSILAGTPVIAFNPSGVYENCTIHAQHSLQLSDRELRCGAVPQTCHPQIEIRLRMFWARLAKRCVAHSNTKPINVFLGRQLTL